MVRLGVSGFAVGKLTRPPVCEFLELKRGIGRDGAKDHRGFQPFPVLRRLSGLPDGLLARGRQLLEALPVGTIFAHGAEVSTWEA